MGLLGLYQDVLTPKEVVPGGVKLTQKLELFWSTDQRRIGLFNITLRIPAIHGSKMSKKSTFWANSRLI